MKNAKRKPSQIQLCSRRSVDALHVQNKILPQNCVVETAKTWLLRKVVVIDAGQIKLTHPPHHNLKIVSPEDFNVIYELAVSLKNFIGMDLHRILVSLFFRDGEDFENIKKLLLSYGKENK